MPAKQTSRRRQLTEHDYATHLCTVLDRKMQRELNLNLNLAAGGGQRIVSLKLREMFHVRAVDAMDWVIRCGIGEDPFDQEKEDEIPILCSFYNEFIGDRNWSENDHTMMTVLNKYDELKGKGLGNFSGRENL